MLQTDQGIKNLSVDQANKLAGENPDYAIEDLYESIANGKYVSWDHWCPTALDSSCTEEHMWSGNKTGWHGSGDLHHINDGSRNKGRIAWSGHPIWSGDPTWIST